MHHTKKDNLWCCHMKAHIRVGADSCLVHTVAGAAANVNDVTQSHALVLGAERDVFSEGAYQGVGKRKEPQDISTTCNVVIHLGERRALDKELLHGKLLDELERLKAHIRARVEQPFWVIKHQFGHMKGCYRGLEKNTPQLHMLFALSNLWMGRKAFLLGAAGQDDLQLAKWPTAAG